MKVFNFIKLAVLLPLFVLTGCAEFGFTISSLTSPSSIFGISGPIDGTVFVPGSTFTITGNCDPNGGNITLTGSSFTEVSISTVCTISGTFSTSATAAANGQLLNIQGAQVDEGGTNNSDNVASLMIHCAEPPMRACAVTGSGNPVDPYSVSTIDCLQEMRSGLACHYELANDIDATVTSTWNGGDGWEPVPNDNNNLIRFTGYLNGNNHSISNLYVTPRNVEGVGLFSRIGDAGGDSVVQNQVTNLNYCESNLRGS